MSSKSTAAAAEVFLSEFVDSEVLEGVDVRVASLIAQMLRTESQQVSLAIALAVAATRGGSVCVDLATASDAFPARSGSEVRWPELAPWKAAIRDALPPDQDASPLVLEGTRLYLNKYWRHERHLAAQISHRVQPGSEFRLDIDDELMRLFPESPDVPPGEDRQLMAARTAATRNLSVIAGGPGTGKTTTIARTFALLVQLNANGDASTQVALAAPTGRASARLKEALVEHAEAIGADDFVRVAMRSAKPTTIHKLLGYRPGGKRYSHDAHNPLPFDAVIVDESSMISLSMMDCLLDAVSPQAKIVLVGDPQQLASVDAGSAFGDIVSAYQDDSASGPVVMLNRVHRFGPEIGDLADSILSGDVASVEEQLLSSNGNNVQWIERSPLEMTAEERVGVLATAIPKWQELRDHALAGEASEAAKLIESARVLCGHRFGPHGVRDWNMHAFSAVFGRPARFNESEGWYAGRPILVQQNDYQLDVYNGDTGVVIDLGHGPESVVFDRSSEVYEVPTSRLSSVQTAFASTVHKSQGSQFKNVIVILPPPESRLMTRELFYTAVTRAQEGVVVVGSRESLAAAVGTVSVRQSGLRDRLLS